MPTIAGILNITPDSFFDGGRFMDSQAALAHAQKLLDSGASLIDVGAASSHPDGEQLSATQEIERLVPVLSLLNSNSIPFAVDSHHTEVQRFALQQGAQMLNDIHGFWDTTFYPELAAHNCRMVIMHSMQLNGPASRDKYTPAEVRQSILDFFDQRVHELMTAGIARHRLLLDPGMGFFLGSNPACSYLALGMLKELKQRYDCKTYVSVSHKSFLGSSGDRPIEARGPATLAAEIFASAQQNVNWIRTHDAGSLHDALNIWHTLSKAQHLI